MASPGGDERRYRPLETVRAFALDHLDAAGGRTEADAALVAWAVELAADSGRLAPGPTRPQADARLRQELPNLRAAWDLAGALGDLDARVALVLDLDDVHDLPRPARRGGWALELAGDPRLADHPRSGRRTRRRRQLGLAAGRLDDSMRPAEAAIAASPTPSRSLRARAALPSTTLFRGDPLVAADLWESVGGAGSPTPAPSSSARRPWRRGTAARTTGPETCSGVRRRAADRLGCPSYRAFALYTAAEMAAGPDPEAAADLYGQAITLARSVGATFVEGVASVGLVRAVGRQRPRPRRALEGYRTLLPAWRRSGHWTQVWTTLRNLADPAGRRRAARGSGHAAWRRPMPRPRPPRCRSTSSRPSWPPSRTGWSSALGPDRVAPLRTAAGALPRGEVVDVALAAIDAALA